MGAAVIDREIVEILASHAGQPVDYVALFMFLNTVAGGHYDERYTEAEIRHSLGRLMASGAVEAWAGECRITVSPEAVWTQQVQCHFRLPQTAS